MDSSSTMVPLNALLCLIILIIQNTTEEPCISADFGNESIVCVCNETYCDTVPDMEEMSAGIINMYVTNRDGQRFNLTKIPFSSEKQLEDFDVLLTPKPSEKLQTIEGFGGAFTDSAVHVINELSKGAQDKLLESYFSPSGIRYTLARVPLGCTDFSLREYSFDPHPGDFDLKNFKLTEEETKGKIPLIKKAQDFAGQDLKLIGCAWTAPSWMKVDNKVLSGGDIKKNCYNVWATYHIRFLEAYNKTGLQFWGLSTGNEPGVAAVSIHWSPSSLALWISNFVGPKLKMNFPDVRLLFMEDFPMLIPRFSTAMNNPTANQYLYGWAVHPYAVIDEISPNLGYAHSRFPNKPILSTEFSVGVRKIPSVILGSWSRAEDYAIRVIKCLNNWATTWVDWNLALDMQGGPTWIGNFIDSAIIVDSQNFYKQPSFYIQGHFSRFLVPGSVKINFTMVPEGVVDITAAVTGNGRIVLIVLNRKKIHVNLGVKVNETSTAILKVPAESIVTALYEHA